MDLPRAFLQDGRRLYALPESTMLNAHAPNRMEGWEE